MVWPCCAPPYSWRGVPVPADHVAAGGHKRPSAYGYATAPSAIDDATWRTWTAGGGDAIHVAADEQAGAGVAEGAGWPAAIVAAGRAVPGVRTAAAPVIDPVITVGVPGNPQGSRLTRPQVSQVINVPILNGHGRLLSGSGQLCDPNEDSVTAAHVNEFCSSLLASSTYQNQGTAVCSQQDGWGLYLVNSTATLGNNQLQAAAVWMAGAQMPGTAQYLRKMSDEAACSMRSSLLR